MIQEHLTKARGTIVYGSSRSQSPLLIVLMGLPGTGKSYVSNHLNKKHSFSVLSGENITYSIFGGEKPSSSQYGEAYEILRFLAAELLTQKHNVIIDGTNLRYSFRKQIYEISGLSTRPVLIHLFIDDATALRRANSRGENQSNPQKILSRCSPETFASFKDQVELPHKNEFCFSVKSDEALLEKIDEVVAGIVKN